MEGGVTMSNLLDLALSAHGGLDRWNRFKVLQARMSVGGAIFVAKKNPGLQEDVTYEILTHEERVTIDRFAMPDRRLRFAPDRLTLETLDGSVVEDRHNPSRLLHQLCVMDVSELTLPLYLFRLRHRGNRTVAREW